MEVNYPKTDKLITYWIHNDIMYNFSPLINNNLLTNYLRSVPAERHVPSCRLLCDPQREQGDTETGEVTQHVSRVCHDGEGVGYISS